MKTSFLWLALLCGCIDDPGDGLGQVGQAATAVATPALPAGAQGADGSRYFPIGVWFDNGMRNEDPANPNFPYLESVYLDEYLRQLKGWGVNHVTTVWSNDTATAQVFDAAESVGGINVLYQTSGPLDFLDLSSLVPDYVSKWSQRTSLLGWYTSDEPNATVILERREANVLFDKLDPAHHSSSTTQARSLWAPQLAIEGVALMQSDMYPLLNQTGGANPLAANIATYETALETEWGQLPIDQPYWQVLQAFGETPFRLPSTAEERYITWLALRHGARGTTWFFPRGIGFGQGVDPDGNPVDGTAGSALPDLMRRMKIIAPYLVDAVRDDPARNGRPAGDGCTADASASYLATAGNTPTLCTMTTFTRANGEHIFILVNRQTVAATYPVTVKKLLLPASVPPAFVDPVTSIATLPVDNGLTWTASVTVGPMDGVLIRIVPPYQASVELTREKLVHNVKLGQPITAAATVTNTGYSPWTAGTFTVGYALYPPGSTTPVTSVANIGAVPALSPGQQTTVNVSVPTGGGTRLLQNGTWKVGVFIATPGGLGMNGTATMSVFVHDAIYFSDTFDPVSFKPTAESWARWNRSPLSLLREGSLVLDGNGLMVARSGILGDATFEADLMIDPLQGSTHAAWVVHATATSGLVFRLSSAGQLEHLSLDNGVLTSLGAIPVPPAIVQPGTWVHVKQTMAGGTYTTYLNYSATPIEAWSTGSHPSGFPGFYAGEADGDHMHADNLVVYRDGITPGAPPIPTNVRVSQTGGNVKIDWNAQTQKEIYQVREYRVYGTSPISSTPALLGNSTRATFQAPVSAGTWSYYVTSVSLGGAESGHSTTVSGSFVGPPATAPAGLTAHATSMRSVALAWSAVPGAVDHYDVFRAPGGVSVWTEELRIASVPTAGYEDAPAGIYTSDQQEQPRPNTSYTYAVQAVDAFGQRGPVATVSAATPVSSVFGGFASGWRSISGYGNWLPSGNSVTQTLTTQSCGTGYLWMGNAAGDSAAVQNFVLDTMVKVNASAGSGSSIGLSFGVNAALPTTSGYSAIIDTQTGVLRVVKNWIGLQIPLTGPAPIPLGVGVSHAFRVEQHGAFISIYVDGNYEVGFFSELPLNPLWTGLSTCHAAATFSGTSLFHRERFFDLGGVTTTGDASNHVDELVLGAGATAALGQTQVRDFTADFVVTMQEDDSAGAGWGGFVFRKTNDADVYPQSGYAAYLTGASQLVLARGGVPLATAQLAPAVQSARIRVKAAGGHFEVSAGGVTIQANDATYASGYAGLQSSGAVTRFDGIIID